MCKVPIDYLPSHYQYPAGLCKSKSEFLLKVKKQIGILNEKKKKRMNAKDLFKLKIFFCEKTGI